MKDFLESKNKNDTHAEKIVNMIYDSSILNRYCHEDNTKLFSESNFSIVKFSEIFWGLPPKGNILKLLKKVDNGEIRNHNVGEIEVLLEKKQNFKVINMNSKRVKIISIITPSYNQEKFIEETIQSVLFQKGDFYIDFIIIDGGSTDNSVKIIKKYEALLKKNCKIFEMDDLEFFVKGNKDFLWNHCSGICYRWISEADNGQVHALKKGFKLARGDIYCWLNSDDIYTNPEVLQGVCTYFKNDPDLELLLGDGPFISKTGEELKLHHVERINLKELIYLDYHILQPSSFFRKNIYDETFLDEKFTCAFDAHFFIGMLINGANYLKVNDSFAAFRFYEENKTLKLVKRRCREQVEIARKYSGNHFFLMISIIYKNIQQIYETRFKKKNPFVWLWIITRRICYKLVTGKWKRY